MHIHFTTGLRRKDGQPIGPGGLSLDESEPFVILSGETVRRCYEAHIHADGQTILKMNGHPIESLPNHSSVLPLRKALSSLREDAIKLCKIPHLSDEYKTAWWAMKDKVKGL